MAVSLDEQEHWRHMRDEILSALKGSHATYTEIRLEHGWKTKISYEGV